MHVLPHLEVYVPWIAMILCELTLFALLWKRPGQVRYRGFEAYITSTLAVSIVLLGISFFGNFHQYFVAYYLGALIKTSALTMAIYEQCKILFFPQWRMSGRSFNGFIAAMGGVVLASIACVGLTPQQVAVWDLATARRTFALSDYLFCGALGLVLIYGQILKVTPPARAKGIMNGLVAASVLAITWSMMLAASSTRSLAGFVGYSTTIGFGAVVISWIVTYSRKEQLPATVVEELPSSDKPVFDEIFAQYSTSPLVSSSMQGVVYSAGND